MEYISDPGTKCCNLKEGWYCIGFLDDDEVMQWGEIIEYVGDGRWFNEVGDEVESLWDSFLRMPIGTDAADAYQPQF